MESKLRLAVATLLLALSSGAGAHSAHKDEGAGKAKTAISTEQYAWGREGDPKRVARTINVDMADSMRFSPSEVTVKRGETVRLVVRNTGKVLHEMVIGTREELEEHAQLMKKHPNMEHEAPYMAHVGPGKSQEIVWTFDKPGTFMYGCLVPGHWEAGMKGSVRVE